MDFSIDPYPFPLDESPEAIAVISNAMELLYANAAFLKFSKEILCLNLQHGKNIVSDKVQTTIADKLIQSLSDAFHNESNESSHVFYNEKIGSIELVHFLYIRQYDTAGRIAQICLQGRIYPASFLKQNMNQVKVLNDSVFEMTFDADCTLINVSDTNQFTLGYSADELAGQSMEVLLLTEELPQLREIIRVVQMKNEVHKAAFHVKVRSGSIIDTIWEFSPVPGTSLFRALVKRKPVWDEQNANDEDRFKSLVQEGSDLIAILDSNGIYTYVSPTLTTVLGVEPKVLLGKNSFDFIHPDDREKTLSSLQRIAQEKRVMVEEEQHLRLLEKVISEANDAVVITEAEPLDEPGPRIVYVNEAFTAITGYTRDEAIGKSPRFLQGPNSNQELLHQMGESMRNWESTEITVVNYKKNGEEFWNNISVSPIADSTGYFTHWIAIQRDVSQQMEAQLEKDLLSRISQAFNEQCDLREALEMVCRDVFDFGAFSFSEIWLPNPTKESLRLSAGWYYNEAGKSFFTGFKPYAELKMEAGLPGIIWNQQKITFFDDLINEKRFQRKELAAQSGIRSAVGIPLMCLDEIIGVLLIGSDQKADKFSRFFLVFEKFKTYIGAEVNRKRLENELATLFQSLPDIVCQSDFNGKFVKINRAACEMLEYEEAEILASNFDAFVHPDDANKAVNALQKLQTGETLFRFENRFITRSGKIIWLSWNCNSNIEKGIIYATAKNITTEKRLTELLNEASALSRIGGWEYDIIGGKLYWSERVHQIHETDPDLFEPTLESGISFYEKNYREMVATVISNALQNFDSFDIEAPIITIAGKHLWVRVIGKVEMSNGRAVRMYGSIQDIHERKILAERVSGILESISEAFFAIDESSNVIYFNKSAEALFRVDASDMAGSNLWRKLPLLRGTRLEFALREALGNRKQENFEFFFHADGKWYEISIYPSGNGVSIYFKDINDRQRSAAELRKAYEEKNTIVESIADAFFTLNRNFIVTYWNRAAEQLIGVKREELIGKNLWEVFPDAVALPSYTNYHLVLKTGQPVTFEDYYGIWLEVNAYPSEEGLTVFFRDISLRKTADERLRKAYDERNQILESIGDGFFALDENGIVTYWNKTAETNLSISKEDIIGLGLKDQYTAIYENFFGQDTAVVWQSSNPTRSEVYAQSSGKWFEINTYPAEKGISVFFKDITSRKQADAQLIEANNRFEKVVEATNDAIWDWQIKDGKVYLGKGFESLFGYELNKVSPSIQFWETLLHPDEREKVVHSIQQAIADKNTRVWELDYRFRKLDGEYADVIDKGIIIRNSKGEPTRMIGAMQDISIRKKYERELVALNKSLVTNIFQLEQVNSELEQFAFVTSHDLQEPLRMITGFMDQLSRKYGDHLDDKAKQYIHFAVDGAKRMKRIILDLLEYSRAGRFSDSVEQIDVGEILSDYQVLRRKLIEEKSVQIRYIKLPVITGHKAPLIQVLHSLLDNSIRYAKVDELPEIKVQVQETADEWIFSVEDNGIGIEEEFHEKIFEMFQRLNDGATYEGSGIGLSIVKKNVESWGGRIWVESVLGRGSTFYFSIKK